MDTKWCGGMTKYIISPVIKLSLNFSAGLKSSHSAFLKFFKASCCSVPIKNSAAFYKKLSFFCLYKTAYVVMYTDAPLSSTLEQRISVVYFF